MNVESIKLPNGLRVVSDRMDSVESVSLGVWVNVGTRHERAEVNGVSHLLEHMAFKGTARRTARDIAEEIEAVGGDLNAYTSRELTVYHATVLKSDVALALDIIGDILQHSAFDDTELGRERAVVLQEIGQSNDTPDDIIFDMFQLRAYPDQPIGRPVLGEADIVSKLPRVALVDYMSERYVAPRMVMAASGNLDPARIADLASQSFAGLRVEGLSEQAPARYLGGDVREKRDLEQVHIVMGFESVPYGDPDHYAIALLATLLGGGMSSRLFQEIREKRGLVYSIYSYASPYVDSGLFSIYAGTGEREIGELVPVLCDEICKVTASISEKELNRARAQIKAGILMSLESTSSRAEQIARQSLIFERIIPVEELTAKINAVDSASVLRAAKRVFSTPLTIAVLGPIGHVESYERIRERLIL